MSIGEYQALIQSCENDIKAYKALSSAIAGLIGNLTSVTTNSNNAASFLGDGLSIDGGNSLGEKIQTLSSNIQSISSSLSSCQGVIPGEITKKEELIKSYENAIEQIIAAQKAAQKAAQETSTEQT